MEFKVPGDLLNSLYRYLSEKPYAEVCGFMEAIKKLVDEQKPAPSVPTSPVSVVPPENQ